MKNKYIKHKTAKDVAFKVTQSLKTVTGYVLLGLWRDLQTGAFLSEPVEFEIYDMSQYETFSQVNDTCRLVA